MGIWDHLINDGPLIVEWFKGRTAFGPPRPLAVGASSAIRALQDMGNNEPKDEIPREILPVCPERLSVLFQLHRALVRDRDGDAFAQKLMDGVSAEAGIVGYVHWIEHCLH